jgi:hypothetical protein
MLHPFLAFPLYSSECFKCSAQFRAYLAASSLSSMISRFSALFSSAAFVKLKLPVMTVYPSTTMTLL